MPSYYAHYRFAEEVYKRLPENLRGIAERNKTLYLTGAHGPDIFFYYKPLKKNAINSLGNDMHNEPAAPFFEKAAKIISESLDREAALAYIFGFITHFMLDSACHGYVAEKMKASGVSHTAVETDLDRELMIADGLDPLKVKPVDYVVPEKKYAEVIAGFFSVDADAVIKSLRSMKRCDSIMIARSGIKRALIRLVLKIAGKYEYMRGLIMTPAPNPDCADSSLRLKKLLYANTEAASDLISEYAVYVSEGMRGKLNSRFDRNYE